MANKRVVSVQWSLRLYLLPSAIPVQPVRRLGEMFPALPGNVHSADGWRNVLEPVVMRYKERKVRLYFRGDAAFASPREYTNSRSRRDYSTSSASKRDAHVSSWNIAHLGYTRPVAMPAHVRGVCHASFSYQAGSWNNASAVSWPKWSGTPASWYPRVGFIVTNLSRPTKRVVAFYNHRGTAEQHIKEGKNAINWTPSVMSASCRNSMPFGSSFTPCAYNAAGILHEDTGFAERRWSTGR